MRIEPVVKRTVTPRSKVGSLAAFTIAAGLVAAIAVGLLYRTSADAAATQQQAIATVVAKGIDSLYSSTIVGPMRGQASTVSDAEMHSRQDGLAPSLARWFVGEPLEMYATRIKAAMAEEIDGGRRDVDGGADVSVTSIVVTGDTATATATADIWLQTATVADVADPKTSGTWNYELHLVRGPGGWRIDHLTFTPAAGTVTP